MDLSYNNRKLWPWRVPFWYAALLNNQEYHRIYYSPKVDIYQSDIVRKGGNPRVSSKRPTSNTTGVVPAVPSIGQPAITYGSNHECEGKNSTASSRAHLNNHHIGNRAGKNAVFVLSTSSSAAVTGDDDHCPQCATQFNTSNYRKVSDSCGHVKCRSCLILSEYGCVQCSSTVLTTRRSATAHLLHSATNSRTNSVNSGRPTSSSPSSSASNDTGRQSSSIYLDSADSDSCLRFPTTIVCGVEHGPYPATIDFDAMAELTNPNTNYVNLSDNKSYSSIINEHSDFSQSLMSLRNNIYNNNNSTHTSTTLRTTSFQEGLVTRVHLKEIPHSNKSPGSSGSPSSSGDDKSKRGGDDDDDNDTRLEDGGAAEKSFPKKKKKRFPVVIHDHITVLEGEPPMYHCTVCQKTFKTKAHIKYHEFCKKGDKPFKCEQCGQAFIAKSHYEYHLRTHTGERPYVCPKCGKGFNQMGKVTRHMRSHTGEKPFVCQECHRGFVNKQALSCHTLIHTGERPFACTHCDKRFTGMTNLKKHVISHTGERRFSCKHCGKSFGLKWTLHLHLRTHSSERPHKCGQCARAFSNSKDLRRHFVVHSGERPFKCRICATAFRRKDNLDRHLKNTHNLPKEVAKKLANEASGIECSTGTRAPLNLSPHHPHVHQSPTIISEYSKAMVIAATSNTSTTHSHNIYHLNLNKLRCC